MIYVSFWKYDYTTDRKNRNQAIFQAYPSNLSVLVRTHNDPIGLSAGRQGGRLNVFSKPWESLKHNKVSSMRGTLTLVYKNNFIVDNPEK
jgi:hypothetical protein